MEYTTKSGKKIEVSAGRGNKPANWKPSGHHYRVTVKTSDGSHTFDFWDSYENALRGKPADLRGAIYCFAGDALVVESCQSAADVQSEFGYDDKKDALRVWNACKKAAAAAESLGLDSDDLYELNDY